jgi:hypothetical protein
LSRPAPPRNGGPSPTCAYTADRPGRTPCHQNSESPYDIRRFYWETKMTASATT